MRIYWIAITVFLLLTNQLAAYPDSFENLKIGLQKDPSTLSVKDLHAIMHASPNHPFEFIEELSIQEQNLAPLQLLTQEQLKQLTQKKARTPFNVDSKYLEKASGTGESYVLADARLWQGLREVFQQVVHASEKIDLPLLLSDSDLFHGHVYLVPKLNDPNQKELLFLLHAKECPSDIAGHCNKNAYFNTHSSYYPKRNYIYLSSINKLFLIHLKPRNPIVESFGFPYGCEDFLKDMIHPEISRVTFLREEYLEKDYNAEHVGDVNLFLNKNGEETFFLLSRF